MLSMFCEMRDLFLMLCHLYLCWKCGSQFLTTELVLKVLLTMSCDGVCLEMLLTMMFEIVVMFEYC